jgi:hypothetical protein
MDLIASEDGARDGSLAVVAEALRPCRKREGLFAGDGVDDR